MPLTFHPLYVSALILLGVALVVTGVLFFSRAEALAQAMAKKWAEGGALRMLAFRMVRFWDPSFYQDPVGQLRWRNRLAGVVLTFMGLVVVFLAFASVWNAECGTVLDLPPCH